MASVCWPLRAKRGHRESLTETLAENSYFSHLFHVGKLRLRLTRGSPRLEMVRQTFGFLVQAPGDQ